MTANSAIARDSMANIMSVILNMRLKVFSMSVELWKTIFDWATVALAAFTFVALAGAVFTGNILNERQAKELRDFQLKVETEQQKTARAQEQAADAQLRLQQITEYVA